jgi:uncharacterized phage protein gp47/JayE
MVRDDVTASLYGAAFIGNNVLRVVSDAMAGLAHHVLRYVDWLSLQLIPDTAEHEWLDRHGDIWLVNADGTTGRKTATYAHGEVTFTGDDSVPVPSGTRISGADLIQYQTTEAIVLEAGNVPTPAPVRAIDPGADGNRAEGDSLSVVSSVPGVDDSVTVVSLTGGTDEETDQDLRLRVLLRIREPPMGGSATDYERWALAVPGVTRAWCAPLEMGIGTVTVRFLMDVLRADDDGWPTAADCEMVAAYIDTVRPVAVKDIFVLAPLKQTIDVHIAHLVPDTTDVRAGIEASLDDMLFNLAKPGQTIFAAWKSYAIMSTPGVVSFDLTDNADDVMQSAGHMAVLGDIVYGAA